MLLEAMNWHPRSRFTRADVDADPLLRHYVEGWQRPDDLGAVAVDPAGAPIGAAWLRHFTADDPGYGFVAPDVPELSIGVVAQRRGQGVGRALLRAAAELAAARGIGRISLSCERANPAMRLYVGEGYVTVESGRDSDTMVKVL